MKLFFVYVLTNASRTSLYTGITSTLSDLIYEHKTKAYSGFTSKYNVNRLVYYERFSRVDEAIAREKQIKGWRRAKKVALIESMNPKWDDLSRPWAEVFKPAET